MVLSDCRSGAASPAGSVTSRSTNHSGSSNSGSNTGSNRSQLVSDVTSGGLKSSSISTYSNSEISTSTSLKSNQAPIGTAIEEYKPRSSRRKEKPTIYLQVIPREVRGRREVIIWSKSYNLWITKFRLQAVRLNKGRVKVKS